MEEQETESLQKSTIPFYIRFLIRCGGESWAQSDKGIESRWRKWRSRKVNKEEEKEKEEKKGKLIIGKKLTLVKREIGKGFELRVCKWERQTSKIKGEEEAAEEE